MSKLVVDATIWVDLLLDALGAGDVERLVANECVSPAHVAFEVGNALIRAERRQEIQPGDAAAMIEQFRQIPVTWGTRDDGDAVAALDFIDNATYADAWYLALAKRLDCPVITSDKGMANAARIHDLAVIHQASE